MLEPAGGTVIFPRLRGVDNSVASPTACCTKRDTAIVPGHFFGAPAHFRVGFSGATEALEGGLRELGAALDAREWS